MVMKDIEGFYTINKPYGMSSQRAVQFVKKWAREITGDKKIKVGHAGTLDPLATGVLIVAVGRAYTKNIDLLVKETKVYEAQIHLGMTSTTDDAEGEKKVIDDKKRPTQEEIVRVLKGFEGDIAQVPPCYSAIKINGKEAYKRVRGGEDIAMQPRVVHIEEVALLSYVYPVVTVRVVCGKGTYIRSLARDIGAVLGVGAYMSGLVRTRIGAYTIADARSLEGFGYKENV